MLNRFVNRLFQRFAAKYPVRRRRFASLQAIVEPLEFRRMLAGSGIAPVAVTSDWEPAPASGHANPVNPVSSANPTSTGPITASSFSTTVTSHAGAGLLIVPTFDTTITSDPNAATIEATINNVIGEYEAVFTDPITIYITFQEMTTGLGQSSTYLTSLPYSTVRSQLVSGASTNNDTTAISHLPNASADPVLTHANVWVTVANALALNHSSGSTVVGGTISLNTSICNITRTTIDPSKYDLAAVSAHEIDEVLGLGSALGSSFTDIRMQDLFRYDQTGARSFTTSPTELSYFSLDGTTDLTQFNQSGGGSDYGDWASSSTQRVQDAFGTPGTTVDPGVEFIALDVQGYHYVALNANHAPVGKSNSVTITENSSYTFASKDFGFTDPNDSTPNKFYAVEITTAPTTGTLFDNGTIVTPGTFIPVTDINSGKLIFTPRLHTFGIPYDSFTFQVEDDGGTVNGGSNLDPSPKQMTINVVPSTTTTLSVSALTEMFGQTDILTATVGSDAGIPNGGNVTFYDGSTKLGKVNVVNGTATLPVTGLSVGQHILTAIYSGYGTSYAGSTTTNSVTVTVTQAATFTSVSASATAYTYGQNETLTAKVLSLAGSPNGGTVTFYSGTTSLGPANLINGTATLTTTALLPGLNILSARYSGSGNFAASSSTVSPTSIIQSVAGNGTQGYTADGVAATSSGLYSPSSIAVDAAGNIFIADSANNRIREVDASTHLISTVAGTGFAGFSGDGGTPTLAMLNAPTGIAVDSAGNLFIVDRGNSRIREVSAATHTISTVAGTTIVGYNGDGIAATSAQLNLPFSIAVDAAGNLFIADEGNGRIREVIAGTQQISTVAGNGTFGYNGDGISAVTAQLNAPYGITVDSAGNLFIADTNNNRIREVNAGTKLISTVAGTATKGFNGDGASATSSQLSVPYAVAVDAAGDLFIADFGNDRIREVNATTKLMSTIVGTGIVGYNGDGIVPTSANLQNPWGVAVDFYGDVFVADTFSNRARIVTPGAPSVTVTAATFTTIQASLPTINLGQAELLTATISSIAGTPNSGTVTFYNGTTALYVANVSNGTATYTATTLPTGNDTITATFNGTSNFAPSTSNPGTTVTVIAVTRPAVSSPTSANITSSSVTLGGNITSNGGLPVTASGVLFSKSSVNPNPQIGAYGVTNVPSTTTSGQFTVPVLNLTPGVLYSFVAYATNSAGTTLTTTIGTFTTLAAPTIAGQSSTVTFTKGSAPVLIEPNLVVADSAGVNLASATVTITNWQTEDQLNFTNLSGFGSTFNVNGTTHTAVLTLTGSATAAAYQATLKTLVYQNSTLGSPVVGSRSVSITVSDGYSNSNLATTSITIKNVNLPPVLAGIETNPLAYKANSTPVAITSTTTISDPDSLNLSSLTIKITSGYQNNTGGKDKLSFVNQNGITGVFNATTGMLTLSGISSLSNYQAALRSVKFSTSGTAISTATRTLTILATDDSITPGTSTPITRNIAVTL